MTNLEVGLCIFVLLSLTTLFTVVVVGLLTMLFVERERMMVRLLGENVTKQTHVLPDDEQTVTNRGIYDTDDEAEDLVIARSLSGPSADEIADGFGAFTRMTG